MPIGEGTPARPVRTPADIANLIVARRRERGFTQAELASRAGVSRAWLAAVEGGKARMEFGLVLGTLAALGIELVTRSPAASAKVRPARSRSGAAAIDIDSIVTAARGSYRR